MPEKTVSHFFNSVDQYTIVCENAYNKNPTEQYAVAVFLCYTKEFRFADQQKVSSKKQTNKKAVLRSMND
jgi:hypothetical protein